MFWVEIWKILDFFYLIFFCFWIGKSQSCTDLCFALSKPLRNLVDLVVWFSYALIFNLLDLNNSSQKIGFSSPCETYQQLYGHWIGAVSVNLYHSIGLYGRRQIDDSCLILSQKQDLIFHAKICMKCQILITGGKKINMLSAESLPRVLSVKD